MEENTKHKKRGLFSNVPLISLAGLVIGAIAGYIYYLEIGCVSGTCAITSNPWMSTLWGAALGYLVFDMFRGKKPKATSDQTTGQ